MGFFRGGAIWCKIFCRKVTFSISGFDTPTLAAVSGVVAFRNWNEPLQVHLALVGGDPTQMK